MARNLYCCVTCRAPPGPPRRPPGPPGRGRPDGGPPGPPRLPQQLHHMQHSLPGQPSQLQGPPEQLPQMQRAPPGQPPGPPPPQAMQVCFVEDAGRALHAMPCLLATSHMLPLPLNIPALSVELGSNLLVCPCSGDRLSCRVEYVLMSSRGSCNVMQPGHWKAFKHAAGARPTAGWVRVPAAAGRAGHGLGPLRDCGAAITVSR